MNSTSNPFAPPEAQVHDIAQYPDLHQPVRILSIKGRIGRMRFLGYAGGSWFIMSFASALTASVHLEWVGSIVVLAIAALNLLLMIQRSHDMNLSGWLFFLAFIPVVNLFWLFRGGTQGPNRFGAPPPPNTWSVKLLALAVPFIMGMGLLAAIVLPGYHDYTTKARSVQR